MRKPICAIAGRCCPETADPTKAIFCPFWVEAVPEVQKDGSGRVVAEQIYRGCFLPRMPLYLVSVTASAGQAAASADDCRNHVTESVEGAVRLLSTAALLQSGRAAALELAASTIGGVGE